MSQQKQIRGALAMAACALFGSPTAPAADGDWQVDTAVLLYSERDRVSALEPVVSATRDLGDEETLNLKLVLDSLTGPSPNGAQASSAPQTFTTPSGNQQYTVNPGEVPLDRQFHDTRGAVSVNWATPLENRLWKTALGASASSEYDFFSLGVSGSVSRDFNRRNTTLTAGINQEMDSIKPVGGTPVPFATMAPGGAGKQSGGIEDRTVTDLLFGITQVIDRNTIMQFNFSLSMASGYLNDPYKVVAVSDVAGKYIHENRPDSRTRQALFWETKHAFPRGDILGASYRFMTDDWGVVSHTVDARYRYLAGDDWYIEPHLRRYEQGRADFYVDAVLNAQLPAVNDIAKAYSADYRLGDLATTTMGARVGKRLAETSEAWARLEALMQGGSTAQADNSAVILEFGYSFNW